MATSKEYYESCGFLTFHATVCRRIPALVIDTGDRNDPEAIRDRIYGIFAANGLKLGSRVEIKVGPVLGCRPFPVVDRQVDILLDSFDAEIARFAIACDERFRGE